MDFLNISEKYSHTVRYIASLLVACVLGRAYCFQNFRIFLENIFHDSFYEYLYDECYFVKNGLLHQLTRRSENNICQLERTDYAEYVYLDYEYFPERSGFKNDDFDSMFVAEAFNNNLILEEVHISWNDFLAIFPHNTDKETYTQTVTCCMEIIRNLMEECTTHNSK